MMAMMRDPKATVPMWYRNAVLMPVITGMRSLLLPRTRLKYQYAT